MPMYGDREQLIFLDFEINSGEGREAEGFFRSWNLRMVQI